MQVRWSTQAADDLSGIIEHIRKDSEGSAYHVARSIFERAASLNVFTERGRAGRVCRERENCRYHPSRS